MPAGPAGCNGAEQPGRFGVGAAYGFADTELAFQGGDFALTQHAVVASLSYQVSERWNLRLSGGAVVDGTLEGLGRRWSIQPGPAASFSASVQLLGENDARLLLNLSMSLGVTFASTVELDAHGGARAGSDQDYTAFDVRVGLVFGATLFDRWTPYVVARAFGGPVTWTYDDGGGRTGTDKTHVQLGVGSAVILTDAISLFVEGVFFGERGVAAGFEVRP